MYLRKIIFFYLIRVFQILEMLEHFKDLEKTISKKETNIICPVLEGKNLLSNIPNTTFGKLSKKALAATGFSGKKNQQYQLWSVLMFQAWLDSNQGK